MKIYTKTGDHGTTQLCCGVRLWKDNDIFAALGALDSLSAHIGIAVRPRGMMEFFQSLWDPLCDMSCQLREYLHKIQNDLLTLGSFVATPVGRGEFNANSAVEELEGWIDRMDQDLPPLRNFILPGGGETAARLHIARTECREAERHYIATFHTEITGKNVSYLSALRYINRLSDFLFTAARWYNYYEGVPDIIKV